MIIAIPSKGRADKMTSQDVIANSHIFVPELEVDAYHAYGRKNVVAVPQLVRGITKTRNWILDYCLERGEKWVVMIDDDVESAGWCEMLHDKNLHHKLDENVKLPDDLETVIGLGLVAYIAATDPASVFLPAAVWHDAATKEGASIQETWPLWKVSDEFEKKCKDIAVHESQSRPDLSDKEREELLYDLRLRAFELTLIVDRYRRNYYEGRMI